MQDKVLHYLDGLQELLDAARQRYTQENGDAAFHGSMAAHELARLQRLSGHALHAAVTVAREGGVTWRDLAPHVQTPFGTLQRQWAHGHRIVVSDPGTPTEECFEDA